MERLQGVDAGFLYMETPTQHMHTIKVGILDTSDVPGGYTFERLRDELASRLHLLPAFRRRVVAVPFGLHHPVWVEDAGFSIGHHVLRRTVASDRAALHTAIGDIAAMQLRRDRPLWEVWVLEGLAEDRIAVVAKIHHAIADGSAAAAMLGNVMSEEPAPFGAPPPLDPWKPEPVPTAPELVVAALRDRRRDLASLPSLLARTARALRSLTRARARGTVRPPRPILDAPRTPMNRALSPDRVFRAITLPLASFKRIKDAAEVAFIDVVLAVAAGALRSYLERRDALPAISLLASVPVGTDDSGVPRLVGNRVSSLLTSLATDVDDPVDRLRRIHEVSRQAKVVQDTLGTDMLERWVQHTPPGPFAWSMRMYSRTRAADRHRPPVNVVVSNVPGPRRPLYVGGAELVELWSVGPILESIGLNLTAWSYGEDMAFGILSCRRSVREIDEIALGLDEALRELERALAIGHEAARA